MKIPKKLKRLIRWCSGSERLLRENAKLKARCSFLKTRYDDLGSTLDRQREEIIMLRRREYYATQTLQGNHPKLPQ